MQAHTLGPGCRASMSESQLRSSQPWSTWAWGSQSSSWVLGVMHLSGLICHQPCGARLDSLSPKGFSEAASSLSPAWDVLTTEIRLGDDTAAV